MVVVSPETVLFEDVRPTVSRLYCFKRIEGTEYFVCGVDVGCRPDRLVILVEKENLVTCPHIKTFRNKQAVSSVNDRPRSRWVLRPKPSAVY